MKKQLCLFFIIFLFSIFAFHGAHAQKTYIPDADTVKETRPISFYQELLLRRMKFNEVENEIERGRLNIEALRLARKLLLQQGGDELANITEKKIHRLQERLSYLEREKDDLEDKIFHQLFPEKARPKVPWYSSRMDLFNLPRILLLLKAQIDITLTQEYDLTKASLEELAKIKELWGIYDKAGDIRTKMETLSGLLDLADLTQSSAGELNQKKIDELINEAKVLLKRGTELIKELRNVYVKNLRDKVEALKELIDLDGEIKPGGEPLIPGKSVVPDLLSENTDSKKTEKPKESPVKPSDIVFTRLELFYQDIAETNKVVLTYAGGAVTTLTGVIKNSRGKPIYFDSMDPPVEGYILVDRVKIKGPGYEITSYLDKSGNVSGNFYFPIVGGAHDYELAWLVNGIEYKKVITIEADTANQELDNIRNYEANISNLINELAEYKPGDYGWNSNWGQIAYNYANLAEAHMFRGDVEETYEATQIGTSLNAIEGRMNFFALLAWRNYFKLRYLACFIGTDEIFGYMKNAAGVDYNFLYDNDLFPYVVTERRTKGEDIEYCRDVSLSNLHKTKAYILMEKIGDYAGAKEEWEEYVNIYRRKGWKFDEMPVSWSRQNR